MAFQPVIDGTHVPRAAIEMVADGSASGVAVMVGSTLEEWKLFSLMDASLHKLDRAGLGARMSRRLTVEAADSVIDSYAKARAQRGESVTPADLFTAIETDRVFRIPGVRLAQVQPRHDARVYSYLFTWPSPAMGGVLGSCHALELGFVFGTNHIPGMSHSPAPAPPRKNWQPRCRTHGWPSHDQAIQAAKAAASGIVTTRHIARRWSSVRTQN